MFLRRIRHLAWRRANCLWIDGAGLKARLIRIGKRSAQRMGRDEDGGPEIKAGLIFRNPFFEIAHDVARSASTLPFHA